MSYMEKKIKTMEISYILIGGIVIYTFTKSHQTIILIFYCILLYTSTLKANRGAIMTFVETCGAIKLDLRTKYFVDIQTFTKTGVLAMAKRKKKE